MASHNQPSAGRAEPLAAETFVVADDGTQLYLRTRDAGPLVAPASPDVVSILNDGIACDGFIWKYLWDALATRSRVAHWHYRGHGRSKAPVDKERIAVVDLARDLSSVRAALGDPQAVLFGHSMGCQVLLENYRMQPEKVRGLVLLCGAPGRVTHTFKGTDALAQVLPRLIDAVDKHPNIARAVWGGMPPDIALRLAFALGEVDGKMMDPKDLLPYLEHMVDMDLAMFLRMLRDAGEHTAEDLLPHIQVPVLVVASDRDSFTPPRLAEQMASTIPRGELFMISGTHAAPLEQRQLVHDRIMTFLDAVLADVEEKPSVGATPDRPSTVSRSERCRSLSVGAIERLGRSAGFRLLVCNDVGPSADAGTQCDPIALQPDHARGGSARHRNGAEAGMRAFCRPRMDRSQGYVSRMLPHSERTTHMTQKDPTLGLPNGKPRIDASMPRSSQNDTSSSITGAAKETASHLAKDAKEELSSRVASQKDKAAEKLGTMADALRSTKDGVGEEVPFVGDYAKKAAEGVNRLSSYIQTRTLGQLVGDVETFARREPALFFGGAFTLGLLAGRFLKSSPPIGRTLDDSPTPRSMSITTTSPGPMPGSPNDGREDLP